MASCHAEPSAASGRPSTAKLALLLIVLATDTATQSNGRLRTAVCGQSMDDLAFGLLPTLGYTGPCRGDPRNGHVEVKTIDHFHLEGSVSILSVKAVGPAPRLSGCRRDALEEPYTLVHSAVLDRRP